MAKQILDFNILVDLFGLPVTDKFVDNELYQSFHSIWVNSDKTKFIQTSDVILKLLKQNKKLAERIDKLEKIIENGVVIDDEDRAMLILKHI